MIKDEFRKSLSLSSANSAHLEGRTSKVPGTISIFTTIHCLNINVTGFKYAVTGDVCSCHSGVQVTLSALFSYARI